MMIVLSMILMHDNNYEKYDEDDFDKYDDEGMR